MSKIFRSIKGSEPSPPPANGFSEKSTDPMLLDSDPGPRELAHRSDDGLEDCRPAAWSVTVDRAR